jgi:competence protein ComEC
MSIESKRIGVAALLAACAFSLAATTHTLAPKELEVTFLDVGQGDAILVQTTGGASILIDGGPDDSVLRELSAKLPWWRRSIDLVVATHPDMDHITGLISVVERYHVGRVLQSPVEGETPVWDELQAALQREGVPITLALRGQRVVLDKSGAYLEVLFPDHDVQGVETNTGSIVVRVVYGDTSFLLTGDMPGSVEEYLVRLDGKRLESSVLKAGHHGSGASSVPLFVGFVSPEHAVFSRGCDNSYGHPDQRVVALFEQFDIKTSDTCLDGRVTFVSDGIQVRRK